MTGKDVLGETENVQQGLCQAIPAKDPITLHPTEMPRGRGAGDNQRVTRLEEYFFIT